ncbi:MAG TPA: hypothetical protein VK171_13470, partial [Fimbriimonas sp.]|nr:hypothetical protein [Fimbriimonas sp.]
TSRMIALGVVGYSRAALEELVETNQKLAVNMIGLVYIASDVTPELAVAAIESIRVFGVFRASPAVREALRDRVKAS